MSLFTPMKDSLDVLLDEALSQSKARRTAALKASPAVRGPAPPTFHETFANPANWRDGKVIAVIHRAPDSTLTLIGAFREYLHKSTEARKLVRIEGPMTVTSEEYVTGAHWLGVVLPEGPARLEDPEVIQDRELLFDLMLDSIKVTSRDTLIRVRLERGWIRSVTLVYSTQFACPTNKVFIHLPKRLDVLEAMSFENKVALKKCLRLES